VHPGCQHYLRRRIADGRFDLVDLCFDPVHLCCRSNCRASRTQLQNLGLDCFYYRAARISAGVLVPELARQERRPCLRAPKGKKRPAEVVSAAVMVGRIAIVDTPDDRYARCRRWPGSDQDDRCGAGTLTPRAFRGERSEADAEDLRLIACPNVGQQKWRLVISPPK
jgi:hypothetical protein